MLQWATRFLGHEKGPHAGGDHACRICASWSCLQSHLVTEQNRNRMFLRIDRRPSVVVGHKVSFHKCTSVTEWFGNYQYHKNSPTPMHYFYVKASWRTHWATYPGPYQATRSKQGSRGHLLGVWTYDSNEVHGWHRAGDHLKLQPQSQKSRRENCIRLYR